MESRIKKQQYYFYGIGVSYFMIDQIFNQWLQYYYVPPESLGYKAILTSKLIVIGFIIIRIIDALSDVVIGYMSDNSNSKMGKRSWYMFLGGVPLGISTILLFFPPKNLSQNLILFYFILVGSIYFISYTMVGGPYNSMISDFSETKEERINLSTVQSIFRLVFTAFPLIFSGKLISVLGKNDVELGIRLTVILFTVIGVIGVYMCVFFLKENTIIKVENSKKEKVKLKSAIKYLKAKEVVFYFLGFFMFFSGFNIIRNILTYYVELVMKQGTSGVTILSAIMFGASAIFFPVTNILAKKYGNRKVMIANLITIILPLIILISFSNLSKFYVYLLFTIMGLGFSGSAFIFPPAMLSELSYKIRKRSNLNMEGLLFGIQGFFLKLAFSLQAIVTTIGGVYGSSESKVTLEGVYVCIIISIFLLILSVIFYYINNKE